MGNIAVSYLMWLLITALFIIFLDVPKYGEDPVQLIGAVIFRFLFVNVFCWGLYYYFFLRGA